MTKKLAIAALLVTLVGVGAAKSSSTTPTRNGVRVEDNGVRVFDYPVPLGRTAVVTSYSRYTTVQQRGGFTIVRVQMPANGTSWIWVRLDPTR